jgi:hypothetical protein
VEGRGKGDEGKVGGDENKGEKGRKEGDERMGWNRRFEEEVWREERLVTRILDSDNKSYRFKIR